MRGNLSRQEVVLHYLSSCLVPMPPFCALKVQETSDRFSSSPLLVSSLVMPLRYTISDYPQNLVVDRMTMRCLTRPPRVCDSTTLNDDSIEVDVDVPSACEKI